MDFQSAIKSCFQKYITFSGRASRSEYWYFSLLFAGVYFVIEDYAMLILGMPMWAVSVRRMHDINKNGWWTLVHIIPILGWIIWLVLATKLGDTVENRYGMPPVRDVKASDIIEGEVVDSDAGGSETSSTKRKSNKVSDRRGL